MRQLALTSIGDAFHTRGKGFDELGYQGSTYVQRGKTFDAIGDPFPVAELQLTELGAPFTIGGKAFDRA